MYVQYGCNVTAVRRSVTLVNSLLALLHEEGWHERLDCTQQATACVSTKGQASGRTTLLTPYMAWGACIWPPGCVPSGWLCTLNSLPSVMYTSSIIMLWYCPDLYRHFMCIDTWKSIHSVLLCVDNEATDTHTVTDNRNLVNVHSHSSRCPSCCTRQTPIIQLCCIDILCTPAHVASTGWSG